MPSDGPTPLALWSVDAAGQAPPTISIGDASVVEGNNGVTTLSFPLTLSSASTQVVRVGYGMVGGVAGGSATGGLVTTLHQGPGGLTSIPDVGRASTYPITINVSGVTGPLQQFDLQISGLTHTSPADVDILLEAPNGQTAVVLSDAGGTTPAAKVVLNLRDDASALISAAQLVSGPFLPFSGSPADTFPAPAPSGPYPEVGPDGATTLNDPFFAINPNGTWKVWIVDDTPGNQGSVGSISLTLGVADATSDVVFGSGQKVFLPGTTAQHIVLPVNGDTNVEPNETIFMDLFTPIGAVIGDSQGVGTILNDDGGSGGGTPPTALNDSYSENGNVNVLGVPSVLGVLANDNSNGSGAMTAVLVSTTSNGTLMFNADGGFSYRRNPGFIGTDTFTYRAENAAGPGNVATVTITITTGTPPPTNLRVDDVDFQPSSLRGRPMYSRATVRFDPPADYTPDAYELAGGVRPGETLAIVPTGSAYPVFTFVPPPGSFFIWVHAVVGGVRSGPSNVVPLHVNTTVSPSPPKNLLGGVNGSSLWLAWNNTFEGGVATNVILDVTGAYTGSLPLGSTETFSFAGVPPGTYNFTVRGVNAGGSSAPSNTVALTFPAACSGPPLTVENFLLYVDRLVLGAIWDLPSSGPAPTGHVLNVTSPIFNGPVTVRTTNVRANVPSGTYTVTVTPFNACGSAVPTPLQSVAVP